MCLLLGCTTIAFSQAYQQEIAAHREKYKNEFLEDDHSPLKQDDLAFLRFYAPDPTYIVHAKFTKVDDPKGFDMQTHNGVIKKYYAEIICDIGSMNRFSSLENLELVYLIHKTSIKNLWMRSFIKQSCQLDTLIFISWV